MRLGEQLVVSGQVIGALVLRDMRTRFGLGYLGFLGSLGLPFIHILVLVLINYFLDRSIPVGTDSILYLSLSILPFILFVYSSRQMVFALVANRALFHFPRVKPIDAIIARIIVELVVAVLLTSVILMVLHLGETSFRPTSWATLLSGLSLAVMLGLSLGVAFMCVVMIAPFMNFVFIGFLIGFYTLSGAFFIPDALPERFRYWLSFNPLLHCTELVRIGYFPEYSSQILDIPYVLWFCAVACALGLLQPWLLRQELVRV
jgi:capsular polysaccharide transport system permease protein